MDVVRAYLRFFSLAFSMSARQTAAFCFELGRKQTLSAQRKELPTTLSHSPQVIISGKCY